MMTANSAPTNEEVKAAVSASPALALLRHRMAVERGRHRPRLARYVEQHRGDGAAEQRAPVDARQHDDRRGRRHGEGQRQQDRDAVGAAEAGQHADEDAEHDADAHQQDVVRLERDRKAVKQIGRSLPSSVPVPLRRPGASLLSCARSQPSIKVPASPRSAPWAAARGTTSRTSCRSRPARRSRPRSVSGQRIAPEPSHEDRRSAAPRRGKCRDTAAMRDIDRGRHHNRHAPSAAAPQVANTLGGRRRRTMRNRLTTLAIRIDEPDIEREESGLRPLDAPADAGLQAADTSRCSRTARWRLRRRSRRAAGTGRDRCRCDASLMQSSNCAAGGRSRRRPFEAPPACAALSLVTWRGSPLPSSALGGAFLRSRPTWRIPRRS